MNRDKPSSLAAKYDRNRENSMVQTEIQTFTPASLEIYSTNEAIWPAAIGNCLTDTFPPLVIRNYLTDANPHLAIGNYPTDLYKSSSRDTKHSPLWQ
jgi:hypothetical protein